MRYKLRMLSNGWAVWDTETSAPAVVEDCWLLSLSMDDADELTDMFNRLDHQGKGKLVG
jgi:hypothetical protein